MNKLILAILVPILLTLTGCRNPVIPYPDGFATYSGSEHGFRAVSPDKVMYRVRKLENVDNADLEFWKVALKTHMVNSGYIVLSESEITALSKTGYQITLAAPVGMEDYTYLLAVFVADSKLIVFESAGVSEHFKKQRDNIISTINNTDIEVGVQ